MQLYRNMQIILLKQIAKKKKKNTPEFLFIERTYENCEKKTFFLRFGQFCIKESL